MNFSEQQQAFLSWAEHGSGSCVLEAVAGAGKTTTVLEAVTRVQGGCAIMAYNKKIADEIKEKLRGRGIDYKKAEAGTVHSFGYRAYRKAFPWVADPDARKVENILAGLRADPRATPRFLEKAGRHEAHLLQLVSLAKQRAVGVLCPLHDRGAWVDIVEHFDLLGEDDGDADLDCIVRIGMKLLDLSTRMTDVIDFDDMVYMPLAHRVRFWRYDVVFVDEAQDTNPARRALVRAVVKPGGRVIAVGDPHQAIYGFTGADADSLDLIAQDFSCVRMPLTTTYRCPKAVVSFAQQWVSHIQAGDTAPEGRVTASTYEDMVKAGGLDGSSVILCRNVAPLVAAAFSLIRQRVACRIEGREVGASLEKLATRWRRARTVNALEAQLEAHQERAVGKLLARKQEAAAQQVEDQCETLRVIISRVREEGRDQVSDVVAFIRDLFADKVEGVLTLSTIHKSKGREWRRVFWLDRAGTCPSRYARQAWQVQQEANLCYVAATRAMEELVDLSPPAKAQEERRAA